MNKQSKTTLKCASGFTACLPVFFKNNTFELTNSIFKVSLEYVYIHSESLNFCVTHISYKETLNILLIKFQRFI